jgi:hydrogenase expression/formation protein HypC
MVLSIDGPTAVVDFGGIRKEVLVATDGVSSGDFVMVHAGVVVGKLTPEEFMANLEFYRDILVQELLDQGLDEKTAREKATSETNKLLASLGIPGLASNTKEE